MEAESAAEDAAAAPIQSKNRQSPATAEAARSCANARDREAAPATDGQELDLSDEWEAISAEVQEAPASAPEVPAAVQRSLIRWWCPSRKPANQKRLKPQRRLRRLRKLWPTAEAEPEVRRAGAAFRDRRKYRAGGFDGGDTAAAPERNPNRNL